MSSIGIGDHVRPSSPEGDRLATAGFPELKSDRGVVESVAADGGVLVRWNSGITTWTEEHKLQKEHP